MYWGVLHVFSLIFITSNFMGCSCIADMLDQFKKSHKIFEWLCGSTDLFHPLILISIFYVVLCQIPIIYNFFWFKHHSYIFFIVKVTSNENSFTKFIGYLLTCLFLSCHTTLTLYTFHLNPHKCMRLYMFIYIYLLES